MSDGTRFWISKYFYETIWFDGEYDAMTYFKALNMEDDTEISAWNDSGPLFDEAMEKGWEATRRIFDTDNIEDWYHE